MPVRQRNREEDTVADETTAEAPAEEAKAEEKKTTKTPVPDGYISPVDFAKERTQKLGSEVKPQMVYGYIKNMKDFPFVERETDAKPRFIVKVPEAHEFLDNKAKAKAEKDAAKAQAAKEAAEKAAAAVAPANA